MNVALFFLIAAWLGVSTAVFADEAPTLAITIDDPAVWESALLAPKERDERILKALSEHGNLQAFLFVTGRRVDNPEGKALLDRWSKAGHLFGNHSYSHFDYTSDDVTFEKYSKDLLDGERIISSYTNFKKRFRFPFIKEGNTAEKQEKMLRFLAQHGYQKGPMTIDASDWLIDENMLTALEKNPKANLKVFRDYYLAHTWERANHFDGLLKDAAGRSIPHTLMIHHNLLNALFLDDILSMFKAKGWKIINAEKAYQDPFYNEITKVGEKSRATGCIQSALINELRFDAKSGYLGDDGEAVQKALNHLGIHK